MMKPLQTDKLLHALVCFAIALTVWLLSEAVLPDSLPTVFSIVIRTVIALAVTALPAVGKELRDMRQPGNHFCLHDLLADAVGAVAGCAVGVVYSLIL